MSKWMQTGCDHGRANGYFLESIDDSECRFLAVHCSSYSKYEEGECPPQNSTVAEMGHNVKRTKLQPPARFYLRTNDKKPFCLENSIRFR
ncbi:hypothetical protein AVEN_232490-1 [Araneus ventricosus]|uniref:Lipase domain-containing protein n=1 Tax=Araneus ventricosus TaxID=182803 RepID=A0A4Y2SZB3_ARAVE|nr:hypothetical protein AVEN_232490-1 [Araneus ventricosus]